MPHFTIEYSANLAERTDIGAICELVRRTALETRIFPIGGIRVRAIRCEHYAIADGDPELCFLAMGLRLGEGRDLASRKAAGEHIFAALCAYLEPVFESAKLGLTFEMVEIKSETSWKKNNIHAYLTAKKGPEHG